MHRLRVRTKHAVARGAACSSRVRADFSRHRSSAYVHDLYVSQVWIQCGVDDAVMPIFDRV